MNMASELITLGSGAQMRLLLDTEWTTTSNSETSDMWALSASWLFKSSRHDYERYIKR